MVSNIFYLNSDKYPAIANDCQQVKDHIERQSGKPKPIPLQNQFMCIFEALPPVRRALCIPNKIQNGEFTTALGMTGLVLINFHEDLRDVNGAINQLKGLPPIYDYKEYQHDFSFFRGTAIEKWLHKQVNKGSKLAKWFYDRDITLADTSFGEKIIDMSKANLKNVKATSIENFKGLPALAYSYRGSKFAELTARALRRTTLFGVATVALLELPKILNAQNKSKQTVKSAINVASITSGISYGGAIGFKYGGSTGSLIGMGLGAVLGNKVSDRLQQAI